MFGDFMPVPVFIYKDNIIMLFLSFCMTILAIGLHAIETRCSKAKAQGHNHMCVPSMQLYL